MHRSVALQVLDEYIDNPNLKKHMLAVESAMRAYAKKFGEDEEWWGIVGLIHDFDYEKYPTIADHPSKGAAILKNKGWPEEMIKTVMAHAAHSGEPRDTPAKKTIFAVDELTGLIVAVTLVKPIKKLSEVDVASVKKKMKNKAFARQVNREEIIQGAKELGVTLDEHIAIVLKSMQDISHELGL
jgi:putative nucleotidyltransferase with HDIG domain